MISVLILILEVRGQKLGAKMGKRHARYLRGPDAFGRGCALVPRRPEKFPGLDLALAVRV